MSSLADKLEILIKITATMLSTVNNAINSKLQMIGGDIVIWNGFVWLTKCVIQEVHPWGDGIKNNVKSKINP